VYRATALARALLLVTVVGCSSPDTMQTATSSSRPGSAAPAVVGPADWPTYRHDNARSGVAPQMSSFGSALGVGWRAEPDGAVYGQPLVIGHQVIAATGNDSVYALSAIDGRWCGRCRWVSRCPVRTAGLAVLVSHVVRSRRGR